VKFIENDPSDYPTVELTRRNLETLLAKLDDPLSAKMLIAPGRIIAVRAVEDDEHYSDRIPGPIYMPSSGETI
jgi:hypothetical protein